jgi:hypothetical protein
MKSLASEGYDDNTGILFFLNIFIEKSEYKMSYADFVIGFLGCKLKDFYFYFCKT